MTHPKPGQLLKITSDCDCLELSTSGEFWWKGGAEWGSSKFIIPLNQVVMLLEEHTLRFLPLGKCKAFKVLWRNEIIYVLAQYTMEL